MGRFFKFAAIALGLYLGWQHFASDSPPARIEGQTAAVEIYTTPQCSYCKQAKAYMNRRGIAYLEKDVEGDLDLRREFYERGGNGVPFLIVYGQPMRGFSEARFEQLLAEGS